MPIPSPNGTEPVPATGPLTAEQIHRWAELIADGHSDFPVDLLAPDQDQLLTEVRRCLRARLVRFFARAIAGHLHHAAGLENSSHA